MEPQTSLTPAQKLGNHILSILNRLKELGIDEPTIRAALRAFPDNPDDQMLFILGTMVSQGKIK